MFSCTRFNPYDYHAEMHVFYS